MLLLQTGIATLGILIAIPLLLMWRTRPANPWLGMFIFSISLLNFANYFANDPGMFGLLDWPVAGFGTFYYFYVRSLIGLPNRPVHVLHFVPFLAFGGFLIWIRVNVPGWTRLQPGPLGHAFLQVVLTVQVLCFIYILMVFRLLHRHRRHLRTCFSSAGQRDLHWLSWLTAILILNLVLWALATTKGGGWIPALLSAQLAMLYFVGWFGTRQIAIFEVQGIGGAEATPALPSESSAAASEPIAEMVTDKYARSGMTDAARDLIGKRLLSRMAEFHDYLDNDIKLSTLAERVGTSPQLVSQYLNHVLGVSFFDYVNGFRVGAVEKRLQDPATEDMTLVELALACGFNSKSTFNAAFKRIHGVAPSVWRKQREDTSIAAG